MNHQGMATVVVLGESDWSNGLCACCGPPGGCGTCCLGTCCPCCLYGQTAKHLTPEEVCCGGDECGSCCAYVGYDWFASLINAFLVCSPVAIGTLLCPLVLFIHLPARLAIRKRYNIRGNPGMDCVTIWCCRSCALIQESNEVQSRLQSAGQVNVMTSPVNVVNAQYSDPKNLADPVQYLQNPAPNPNFFAAPQPAQQYFTPGAVSVAVPAYPQYTGMNQPMPVNHM